MRRRRNEEARATEASSPSRRNRHAARGFAASVKTIVLEAVHDDIVGESAKAAYFFFLSLFPAILALFAFTGIFGGQVAFDAIMGYLRDAMPGQAASYLGQFVQEITGRERPGMLSLGLVLTLWSASNIFGALAEGLNVMYDVEESRSFWKRKALSIVSMVGSLTLFAAGAAAILAGPSLIHVLHLPDVWHVLRWPVAFGLVTVMICLIYYLLPNRTDTRSKKATVSGALCGATLWTAATIALRLYLAHFGSYSKTYGVVGGIMVLLIWLYLSAFAVLLGGEIAATLEQKEEEENESESAAPDSELASSEASGQ